MKYIFSTIILAIILSGCNQSLEPQTLDQTTQAQLNPSPTQEPSQSPTNQPTTTPQPIATRPVEIKSISTPSASPSPTQNNQYTSNSNNSSTNISVNSNNTSVKIYTKEGKRYAKVNGKELELDANGCYKYDDGSTKIESCVNSN